MSTPRTERITKAASLSEDVARWAEEQARAENRSFSNFIETLLIEAKSKADVERTEPEAMAA
jgi:predicted CopG family antitoxin